MIGQKLTPGQRRARGLMPRGRLPELPFEEFDDDEERDA